MSEYEDAVEALAATIDEHLFVRCTDELCYVAALAYRDQTGEDLEDAEDTTIDEWVVKAEQDVIAELVRRLCN